MDALTAWATVATAVVAFLGVWVAWYQLRNLNSTLRMNSLAIVLQIETEMNARKLKVDEIAAQIRAQPPDGSAEVLIALKGQMDGCLENWLNAADRLAFCIVNGYLTDECWKADLRGYFANLVKNHSDKFGPDTIYTNILDVHNKWQRS